MDQLAKPSVVGNGSEALQMSEALTTRAFLWPSRAAIITAVLPCSSTTYADRTEIDKNEDRRITASLGIHDLMSLRIQDQNQQSQPTTTSKKNGPVHMLWTKKPTSSWGCVQDVSKARMTTSSWPSLVPKAPMLRVGRILLTNGNTTTLGFLNDPRLGAFCTLLELLLFPKSGTLHCLST